jgi:hypothetical protein
VGAFVQEVPTRADENPLVGFDWLLSTRPASENYDAQSGDTEITKFRSTGGSADVRFGMRNQNNTHTEFHIAKTSCAIANQLQLQCRYRAIDSGVLAISRAPLSGDVVLDSVEEGWWLNERWWTK